MAPNQARPKTGEKAKPYPISVYQATIDDLNSIKLSTGESHGAIVRRLVEAECRRVLRRRVATWEVLTFPSYHAAGEPVPTVVLYHTGDADAEVIKAVGDRLLPVPPEGSLVVVRRSELLGNLYGTLVRAELDESEDEPKMTLTVESLPVPAVDRPERRRAYVQWVDDVFEGVGKALGAPVPPTGSDRTIGRFRVAHTGPLDDAGSVGWSVAVIRSRRGRRLEPVLWDATSPLEVVGRILDAGEKLEGTSVT
jgi:hypothetical protein